MNDFSLSLKKGASLALMATTMCWSGASAGASVTVEVESDGATLFEAQQNGVRLALQQVVRQTIVVDRAIKDDEVIRDSVMSSMSGFVENIQVMRQSVDSNDYARLKMQVTVSTTEVENYVQNLSGQSNVKINALFAEGERELAARAFRNTFVTRLFRGYPYQAVQTKLLAAGIDKDDPNKMRFTYQFTLDQRFIDAVVSGAKRIACTSQQPLDPQCSSSKICWPEMKKPLFGPAVEQTNCVLLAVSGKGDNGFARGMSRSKPQTGLDDLREGIVKLGVAVRFKRQDGSRIGSDCYDLIFGGNDALVVFERAADQGVDMTVLSLKRSYVGEYRISRGMVNPSYVKEGASMDALPVLVDQVRLPSDGYRYTHYASQFDITNPSEGLISWFASNAPIHKFRDSGGKPEDARSTMGDRSPYRIKDSSPQVCRWTS